MCFFCRVTSSQSVWVWTAVNRDVQKQDAWWSGPQLAAVVSLRAADRWSSGELSWTLKASLMACGASRHGMCRSHPICLTWFVKGLHAGVPAACPRSVGAPEVSRLINVCDASELFMLPETPECRRSVSDSTLQQSVTVGIQRPSLCHREAPTTNVLVIWLLRNQEKWTFWKGFIRNDCYIYKPSAQSGCDDCCFLRFIFNRMNL